jgi:hypothetical protein
MTKMAGSGSESGSESGSISERHGSADPDSDPLENVMDPPIRTLEKIRKKMYNVHVNVKELDLFPNLGNKKTTWLEAKSLAWMSCKRWLKN